MFWKFEKRAEVSGTWKVQLNDSKSCIVNFCYCSFTGVFKELRANFLPRSYFSMNFLVKVGKMLFNSGRQAKNWNKWAFQMQVMRLTVSSSNGIGAKSRKYVGLGCSPSPSFIKKTISRSCYWMTMQMIRLSLSLWRFFFLFY